MFKLRIKEAAKANGVKNYYQLGRKLDSKKTGEIRFEVLARRLWAGKTNPTFKTMAAVCAALECDFGDLVVRVNGKQKRKVASERRVKR